MRPRRRWPLPIPTPHPWGQGSDPLPQGPDPQASDPLSLAPSLSGWLDPAWGSLLDPPSGFAPEMIADWDIAVRDEADELVCEARLPGVKSENIRVAVFRDGLMISAQHQEETEVRGEDTYQATASVSAVTRTIPFPHPVRAEGVTTDFRDGVLRVRLPKA